MTIANNTLYRIDSTEIFVTNAVFDGALAQTAVISNNTLSKINETGIAQGSFVRGGGEVNQGLTISGNTIDVPDGFAGIDLFQSVGFGAGSVTQNGVISNNTVTGGPEFGLLSYARVRDSANAVVSQTFLVTGNHFSDDFAGVAIRGSAEGAVNSPKINGSWTLAGNTITNNFRGVEVLGSNSPVTENVFLSSAGVTNTITGNTVGVYGHTFNGALVTIDRGQNILNGVNGTGTAGNATFSN